MPGLLIFGWSGTIGAIIVAIVVSFLLCGYWYPYWRRADMDIMLVYQPFAMHAGQPRTFFDHPGHLHVVLINLWFSFLHKIGLLDVVSLANMPSVSDVAGFERVWTAGVRAGRVMSLLIVTSFVGAFAILLRRVVADWRVAALGAFMFAFASGVMWQARVMRTDLLAAGFALLGLLLLLWAARAPASNWRPLVVGTAAMLCTLGVVNKVQALLLALAWPVVVLTFGVTTKESAGIWRSPAKAAPVLGTLALLAALLAIPTTHLFVIGFSAKVTSIFALPPPPFGITGLYQGLIAAWILCGVIVFALVWHVPALETLATLLTVPLGVAIGLMSLYAYYHPQNVIEVFNPFELMLVFAGRSDPQLVGDSFGSAHLLTSLGLGFLDVLARVTFVLHTSSRATVFLQWVVIAGIVIAWKRNERRLALQLGILLLTAWGIDTAGNLRDLKLEYSVFSDPIIVIAAAWLLVNLPDLASHRWAFPVGAGLLVAHVVFSQIEPVKTVFLKAGPERHCEWIPRYAPLIERFPFCPPQT